MRRRHRVLPGDIISTGTPGVVGIRAGDVLECRIGGFEPLSDPVVRSWGRGGSAVEERDYELRTCRYPLALPGCLPVDLLSYLRGRTLDVQDRPQDMKIVGSVGFRFTSIPNSP